MTQMRGEFERFLLCSDPEERKALLAGLFTQHRERLRCMVDLRLDRRLRSRVDPSDILQEAYLEASQRLTEYLSGPAMPPYLWLRRITFQKLIDIHRFHVDAKKRDARRDVSMHRARGPHTDASTLAGQLVARVPTPSRIAIGKEARSQIEKVLESMGPVDREIIALRHFEQLTTAEAAVILGIENAAARKRYIRAVKKLKDIIEALPASSETP